MKPSIDLNAELVSITRRQHLNDVHFAVALVRHAMRAGPERVKIKLGGRKLVVEHDGRALDASEHNLLLAVLSARPDDERHRALAALERGYGVALLSALATSDRATLHSERSLVVEGGQAREERAKPRRGWRLTLHRPLPRPRVARRELAFYCSHAPIPVIVDGKDLSRPLQLRETLLHRRYQAEHGDGICGIPRERALSRVRYFKHGVYFGVRASLPSDGRAVEAMFNSTLDEVEDNFRRSIHAANRALRDARTRLYDDAAARFAKFDEADKAILARAFLRVPPPSWTPAMRDAPLLHTASRRWARSLAEVIDAGARGIVPYTLRADPEDPELLLLTPDEVRAVRRLTRVQLRRALPRPRPRAPVPARGVAALPRDQLTDDERLLVDALATREVALHITASGAPGVRAPREVELPRGHPAVANAAARLRASGPIPAAVELVSLAILGAADTLSA